MSLNTLVWQMPAPIIHPCLLVTFPSHVISNGVMCLRKRTCSRANRPVVLNLDIGHIDMERNGLS
jgi:hypothetical protein